MTPPLPQAREDNTKVKEIINNKVTAGNMGRGTETTAVIAGNMVMVETLLLGMWFMSQPHQEIEQWPRWPDNQ